ncbi:MAG TPA: hypothetical protein VGC24_11690 [Burkholderiaceae bacterium]
MRSEVKFILEDGQELAFNLDEQPPMAPDAARWWLDDQFQHLDCEPLRPTGKVLIADKVICVARAAGPQRFADPQWSGEFARATRAALAKPVVVVDLAAMTVAY